MHEAALAPLYVPAVQLAHGVAGLAVNVPAVHAMQALPAVLYCPPPQVEHELCPADDDVPAAQALHAAVPSPYCPAAHTNTCPRRRSTQHATTHVGYAGATEVEVEQ